MANTVRLQVLVSEEVREGLDTLRGNMEMSAYLRAIIVAHAVKACKTCGK